MSYIAAAKTRETLRAVLGPLIPHDISMALIRSSCSWPYIFKLGEVPKFCRTG